MLPVVSINRASNDSKTGNQSGWHHYLLPGAFRQPPAVPSPSGLLSRLFRFERPQTINSNTNAITTLPNAEAPVFHSLFIFVVSLLYSSRSSAAATPIQSPKSISVLVHISKPVPATSICAANVYLSACTGISNHTNDIIVFADNHPVTKMR
jgi:hypothetical protein